MVAELLELLYSKNKTLFFDNIISKHYKIDASKLSDKEKREKIKDISQTQMSTYLKNADNTFFKTTYDILDEDAEDFTKSFIELLFRTKLSQLEESGEFKFYLITAYVLLLLLKILQINGEACSCIALCETKMQLFGRFRNNNIFFVVIVFFKRSFESFSSNSNSVIEFFFIKSMMAFMSFSSTIYLR